MQTTRTIGVSHFLLSGSHVSKVIDNGLSKVFQSSQLQLQRLQLLSLTNLQERIIMKYTVVNK